MSTLPSPRAVEGCCHCGAIRFKATIAERRAYECNCSICTKKGFLHLFVTRENFEYVAEEDALATYTFNTHVAKHHFCRRCGMHPFYVPRSHPDGIDINVRCLDDVDLERFEVEAFDGKHWESAERPWGTRHSKGVDGRSQELADRHRK